MTCNGVKVADPDICAGWVPAQKYASEHARTACEGSQFRRRWTMLPAQQFSKDVPGRRVVSDQLGTEPFGRQKEVDRGRVLPAHGVRTG